MLNLARPKTAIQVKYKNTHYYNQQELDTVTNYKSSPNCSQNIPNSLLY